MPPAPIARHRAAGLVGLDGDHFRGPEAQPAGCSPFSPADGPATHPRGLAPAGEDHPTSARRHVRDGGRLRTPVLAVARPAAGRRPEPTARPALAPVRGCRGTGRLSTISTRCLSRSRPASAIAAMPPLIADAGTKDTAGSSNSITQPISRAAIPPKAVNVCPSQRMTGVSPGIG
jgi:hypothetical protein